MYFIMMMWICPSDPFDRHRGQTVRNNDLQFRENLPINLGPTLLYLALIYWNTLRFDGKTLKNLTNLNWLQLVFNRWLISVRKKPVHIDYEPVRIKSWRKVKELYEILEIESVNLFQTLFIGSLFKNFIIAYWECKGIFDVLVKFWALFF